MFIKRVGFAACRAFSISIPVLLLAQPAQAQTTLIRPRAPLMWLYPLDPGYPLYPGYWGYPLFPGYWMSFCYPYVSCAAYQRQQQIFERRQERFEQLRKETQEPAAGVQINPVPAAKSPPTDIRQIQPRYLGASQLLPQYETTGDYLPGFLEGKARPGH
jgi:hypothetical protein